MPFYPWPMHRTLHYNTDSPAIIQPGHTATASHFKLQVKMSLKAPLVFVTFVYRLYFKGFDPLSRKNKFYQLYLRVQRSTPLLLYLPSSCSCSCRAGLLIIISACFSVPFASRVLVKPSFLKGLLTQLTASLQLQPGVFPPHLHCSQGLQTLGFSGRKHRWPRSTISQ